MQCQVRGCGGKGSLVDKSPQWGVCVGGVCTNCFERAKREVENRSQGLHADYVEDYARIYLLLNNTALADTYLVNFNAELPLIAARQDFQGKNPVKLAADPQYIRLSRALDFLEGRCYFPTAHLLPLGLLTSADFLHYIRLGYVLKDYGAGVKHGEFTHRLQWQIIIRANTADYQEADPTTQGWNKTPLDLYVTLGKAESVSGTGSGGLWAFLLDNAGDDNSYRYPDRLHRSILTNPNAAVLVANLSRRDRKRRDEFVAEYKSRIVATGADISSVPDPKDLQSFPDFYNRSTGIATEHWDANNHVPVAPPVTPTANRLLGRLLGPSKMEKRLASQQQSDNQNALFNANEEARKVFRRGLYDQTSGAIGDSYKTKKVGYAPDTLLPGGVQKLVAEAPHDKADIDARVIQSYKGFQ